MPHDTFRKFIWGKLEITLAVAVKDPPGSSVMEMLQVQVFAPPVR
jgi:hypothetical protein